MRFRYFVLFSLVCVFMLFGSCSFAYSIDDFIVFCSTVKDDFSNGYWSANFILQTESNFRNVVGNSYNSFVVIQSAASVNGTRVYVRNTPTTPNVTTNNITFSGNDRNNWKELYYYEGWHLTNYTAYFSNLSSNNSYGLLVINNDITNWGNMFFNNRFIPPYTGPVFTPSNNGTIQVIASNNVSETMLRLPFTYTGQSDWTLGYLTDYDEVYSIFGYFGPLFYRDGQLYTESYQNEFTYNIYSGTNNSGLLFDSSSGRISIKREKLVNKQGYNLLLRYRLNNGDALEDIGDYNYYAYFYNLNISSGDLVSPDINSNVDIGMLNALDDYFSYDSGDNISSNIIFGFSGDFFSGDIFSSDILNDVGLINYTNNEYSLTLYGFYRRIINVLLDDSTTSYIEFNYRGNDYRFYASDFRTPDGPLKIFVSGFIIVLLIIGFIKWLAILFKKMATLDYIGVSKSFDIDDSNFL